MPLAPYQNTSCDGEKSAFQFFTHVTTSIVLKFEFFQMIFKKIRVFYAILKDEKKRKKIQTEIIANF